MRERPLARRVGSRGLSLAAMDIDDEHVIDDLTDDSDEATYRERATALLDQIAQQAKQALSNAGIDIDLFFLIPRSGDAILTFGTLADPPDDLWSTVSSGLLVRRAKLAWHRANAMRPPGNTCRSGVRPRAPAMTRPVPRARSCSCIRGIELTTTAGRTDEQEDIR